MPSQYQYIARSMSRRFNNFNNNFLCVPQVLDQNLYHIKDTPPKLQLPTKTLNALSCRYCSPSPSVSETCFVCLLKMLTTSTVGEIYICRRQHCILSHTHAKSIFDFIDTNNKRKEKKKTRIVTKMSMRDSSESNEFEAFRCDWRLHKRMRVTAVTIIAQSCFFLFHSIRFDCVTVRAHHVIRKVSIEFCCLDKHHTRT